MNANLDTAISHVNSRPDYFYVSAILLTIALMCLSVVFLTHKAKLSGIALPSAEFPSNSAANAPLMMHNEARGEAGTALFSSPTFVSGESDNSPTLEWNPSLSKTLNQSPNPGTISNAVEKAAPPGRSRTKTNRKDRRYVPKRRVRTSLSFRANLHRFFGWFRLR
jgi:hypothetical protein